MNDDGLRWCEMLPATLIAKKRDGLVLSDSEIRFLIEGFVAGDVTDYQMSALAMAILLKGMTADEVAALTLAMRDSGERLPRGSGDLPRVDKHSTGGLGDKVSLVLAPLLACHDVHVPMISGRGLGLSGGTLDKLEAIPGFRVQLQPEERDRCLRETGFVMIGASEKIAPADRRLYAIRDVTATVESVALITASILSKKLAANLDALIMDVKVGGGAFMKTTDQAKELADSIVKTARLAGMPTRALITDMDQPLGHAVGNAIEVNESLELLDGGGPSEVRALTIELSAEVLHLVGRFDSLAIARQALRESLDSGAARERFDRMVVAQGGTLRGPLPLAGSAVIESTNSGFVSRIDCEALGRVVVEMGGGRRTAADAIDPSVGAAIHVRVGDHVATGQKLLTVYARDHLDDWATSLRSVVTLSDSGLAANSIILNRIAEDGTCT